MLRSYKMQVPPSYNTLWLWFRAAEFLFNVTQCCFSKCRKFLPLLFFGLSRYQSQGSLISRQSCCFTVIPVKVLLYFLLVSKILYLNLNGSHICSLMRSRVPFKCSMGLSQMNNCPSAYGSLGTTNQLSGRCFTGNYSNLHFARFLMNRTA